MPFFVSSFENLAESLEIKILKVDQCSLLIVKLNEQPSTTMWPGLYLRPPHKIVSDLSEEEVEKITQGFAGRKLK